MIEQLTADEKAFDIGYDDCMSGACMLSEEDWESDLYYKGTYSSYVAGYNDCQNDNEDK